jgi:hypothetical protein
MDEVSQAFYDHEKSISERKTFIMSKKEDQSQ